MSAKSGRKAKKMEDREILNLLRNSEAPVVTATQVAEHFGCSNEAVRYRLGKLQEENRVNRMKVGSSAVVWWAVGDRR